MILGLIGLALLVGLGYRAANEFQQKKQLRGVQKALDEFKFDYGSQPIGR